MRKGKKGQQLLENLVLIVAAVILFSATIGVVDDFVEIGAGNLTDPGAATTTRLVPLFMALALIVAIFTTIQLQRPSY